MKSGNFSEVFKECSVMQDRRSYSQAGKTLLVNPSTVHRMGTVGVRGPDGSRVRLETVRIGGRFFTSRQAIDRFVAAINEPPVGSAPAPRSPAQRRRASELTT